MVDNLLVLPMSSWLNFFNLVPETEMPLSEGLLGKLGVTFPSILRLDEDLGVKTDELELAVPNLEDIDEYPEVNDVGPEVGSPSELLKMGGKDTG